MRSPLPEPTSVLGRDPGPRARIPGIDVARGLALLGMVAVHLLPLESPGPGGVPEPTWAALWFAGKASTLFAVLAGTGLGLLAGGAVPLARARLAVVRRSVAARAGIIAVLGLGLAALDVPVAIILAHYGLLFIVTLPFLGLGARALARWAVGWLLLAPWLLAGLDTLLSPGRLDGSPGFTDLADPASFAGDLLLGGFYPVLLWTGFILLGLFLGRLRLNRPATAVLLLCCGTVLAAGARLASDLLLGLPGALGSLARATDGDPAALPTHLRTGQHLGGVGNSEWFQAIAAPHSGSLLDVLLVAGTAVAVLGACQLLAMALSATGRGRAMVLLWPLAGAGSATLTLYSAHLLALHLVPVGESGLSATTHFAIYVAAALAFGLLLRLLGRRGPLESAVHAVARSAASAPSAVSQRGRLD
ncbi:heparan-alpha-glucosaminide N-acetyltransferase domain-containing protein [Paeniglutamicibacter cryotolerans]|uniref:Putative membrane protein YeiB n=1 Tax=Paeniglutamicibacter cryotolerans TaxID=670079 RepID=A0A839QQA9_9MICC|nr:heparan-alpha-glucosaminide N-acetyltransferase domain-containing protein [Paeniglutamicibacter cryotolerans]MBB2996176.1 putative membrane protein YeiB [Paeniglutamicibacter cryotolerans]